MLPPESSSGQPAHPGRVLIVDDDAGQRSLLNSFLQSQAFLTETASSGEEALQRLKAAEFAMLITDVRMPGISGLETLRRARQDNASLPILLVTAFADIREAVDAMRDGAVNYLSKPIDLDELLASVRKALGFNDQTTMRSPGGQNLPQGVVAESPLMLAVFRDISLIAPSESRVLITGESGVGKEVVADAIHASSHRSHGPLIKLNCAAIPEPLLESELFGHEKGAFTGATAARRGRFELAHGGTLFLDEISEMAPRLQAKLLRITQDGGFQRLGSSQDLHTDARIIAASNRNLEEEVRAGRFREDLFYRLNVVEINLPPLRERHADIIPLARQFLGMFSQNKSRLSPAVTEKLLSYGWPGNVRELRNAMERAALLSRGELILPEHLPSRIQLASATTRQEGMLDPENAEAGKLDEIERHAIMQALEQHQHNRTETARALGISRRTLLYKLQRFREQGYPVDNQKSALPEASDHSPRS